MSVGERTVPRGRALAFADHSRRGEVWDGGSVASEQECERAVRVLVERLADVDPAVLRRHAATRTVSCRLHDLDLAYVATIGPEGLAGLTCLPAPGAPRAQVRLTLSSDDLIELVEGRLTVRSAWAAGRMKVDAGVLDLLKLRQLF